MPDTVLNVLKKDKKNLKSLLTRFKNFVDNINEQVQGKELELRINKIEPILDSFYEIQRQIGNLDESIDHDLDIETEQFEDAYFKYIGVAKSIVDRQVPEGRNGSINGVETTSQSEVQSLLNPHQQPNIKLPPMPLPTFDGAYDQWLFFKDTFISLIHENEAIPEIQKFHYLRLSLKGSAADLLKCLQISANNYSIAWDLLVKRFENSKILVRFHIKALFELEILKCESHLGLRNLLDSMNKHLRALEVLRQPVDSWDALIIHIISVKLDSATRKDWEAEYSKQDVINLTVFTAFLQEKSRLLETLHLNTPLNLASKGKRHSFVASNGPICSFCGKGHTVYNCKTFLELNANKRLSVAKKGQWCLNCLRLNHRTEQCRSAPCRKCSKRHNTLLHNNSFAHEQSSNNNAIVDPQVAINDNQPSGTELVSNDSKLYSQSNSYHCYYGAPRVLLSTAIVDVLDSDGNVHFCRVLLDSGSESSFITEQMFNKLKLGTTSTNISVSGIGLVTSKVLQRTEVKIQARHSAYEFTLQCLILPKITSKIPCMALDTSGLKIPSNLILADPSFDQPNPIDILIGIDKFWELLCTGQIKLGKNLPVVQKTHLGWVISGPILSNHNSCDVSCNVSTTKSLEDSLTKFWQLEERHVSKPLSIENQRCEDLFLTTTSQRPDGHFVVHLPLKHSESYLGHSKEIAIKRFLNVERKLNRNPSLKSDYTKFLDEYETLGHMTQTSFQALENKPTFYLPHHGVINNSSETTKLRVVFDGSSKSSSGYSLNDILMVGPTVQQDLFSIVLRARKHEIMLTGDIAEMYRQVYVHENQCTLQIILWRSNQSLDIQPYMLKTVTYGTAPAAYLATRCLKEVSIRCSQENPIISRIIAEDFYVDDLCTGANTVDEVLNIKQQVSRILKSAGFELRKFHCNSDEVMAESAIEQRVHIGESSKNKTLGLYWDTANDTFKYSLNVLPSQRFTKRTILSCIAQIFDPLGFLAPVVILAKLIIQRLWQCKIGWDESIPLDILTIWREFYSQLDNLNNLEVSRKIIISNHLLVELHGFADASEAGYGACIYVRSVNSEGSCYVSLLCSKTRVAPIKTTTIPRLELCAALLLAELYQKVIISLNISFDKIFFWSDSSIVLTWIKSESQEFKIFVANRVSQVQSLTNPMDWKYVPSKENPADLLSRGVSPGSLISSSLWWKGPTWLTQSSDFWPQGLPHLDSNKLPEKRKEKVITLVAVISDADIFNKFSTLTKLQRVVGYVRRFISNCKSLPSERQFGFLNVTELKSSLLQLVKWAQHEAFIEDISYLVKYKTMPKKSKLLKLNPFLDAQGILRVGGRLMQSIFSEEKKYPAILPAKHRLTLLIAQHEHHRLLHAGPQHVLASLRERFWPLSARNLVRKIVRECSRCVRFNPPEIKYIMGNLPKERLTPSRPFMVTGVDYMGPIMIKDRSTRNYKTVKAWVCLFICFATRAMHLELVGDLSTNTFLAALRRFFSRRGLSSDMFSDHGSNFIGAQNEIQKMLKSNHCQIQSKLSADGVRWHFIPPKAPHFGGLWEAGVKSTKYHLKRVTSGTILSYEELCTVLTQIEACLNSRPISPMSSDPSDPQPLTPAHFLIGERLTNLPENDYCRIPENRLSRFQRLQQMIQSFWARWSKEYVAELQQRTKWKKNVCSLLSPGCVVLIKEDGLPPLKWMMGVVQEVHPGSDGVIRTATIKAASSILKRPVTKLCILPRTDL